MALALAALAAVCVLLVRSPESGIAQQSIGVDASLKSCSDGATPSCEIAVSFRPIAGAAVYETTITAPNGAELITMPAAADAETYSVPYVGDGTYGVRVTAFG